MVDPVAPLGVRWLSASTRSIAPTSRAQGLGRRGAIR
jgi:hypothetical protein